MRLIDADAARDDFAKTVYAECLDDKDNIRANRIIDAFDDLPTIEANLVRHGKWIDRTAWCGGIGRCEYECSNCGYRVMHKPNSRGDGKGGKFCDNCGAKMDGGCENETD